jgi:hypothetical protein
VGEAGVVDKSFRLAGQQRRERDLELGQVSKARVTFIHISISISPKPPLKPSPKLNLKLNLKPKPLSSSTHLLASRPTRREPAARAAEPGTCREEERNDATECDPVCDALGWWSVSCLRTVGKICWNRKVGGVAVGGAAAEERCHCSTAESQKMAAGL